MGFKCRLVFPVCHALLWSCAACLGSCSREGQESGIPQATGLLETERLSGFKLLEKHARRHSSTYVLARGDEILRIEVVGPMEKESARTLVDDGVMGLEALYASALSPYPGDISREIAPGKKHTPRLYKKEREGIDYTYFELFANERMEYAVASDDILEYRALLGWFFCQSNKKTYKIKYFAPLHHRWEDMEGLFLGSRCAG